jgi:hypothetical protein
VSAATAGELVRVLAYPEFRLSPEEREELLADYLPYVTMLALPAARADRPRSIQISAPRHVRPAA